jgi:hypothetical protein
MKVKLSEYYQDARHSFTPEQEVDVDAVLGTWLVEHRKAIKLEVVKAQPEPADNRRLAKAVVESLATQTQPVAAVDEPPTQPPAEETPQPKRSKRGKQ